MKGKINGLLEYQTPEHKSRYHRLARNPPNWRRPKAENVAKDMDLTFLYRYGYDYASRYVHPMADDGLEDFQVITLLQPKPESTATNIVVLQNSVLVASMVLQEALNASSFAWMKIVYDAIDGVRSFLLAARTEHLLQVAKVGDLFAKDIPLAKQPDHTSRLNSSPTTRQDEEAF